MNAAPADLQLVTCRDVARMLAVSSRTAQRLVRIGMIGHHKVGRLVRVPRAAVIDFLDRTLTPPRGN